MKAEEKLMEGWGYVCKHCQLSYQVYGSRLRCDVCNRKLKLTSPEGVAQIERA